MSRVMKSLFFALATSCLIGARADDPSTALHRVGGQGVVDFYVAGEKLTNDPALLEARLRKACASKATNFCQIMVWADTASVPRALPMSDNELRAQIAQYNLNERTGYDCFRLLRDGKSVDESMSPGCR